ncbi:hypothetical protein [Aureimonas phyllosphaerae]|uniref:Alkylhydroperoxidase family enzyme n=1 Tax=Aureimonas phyllosphaerae TaxID=1166078 RepID=A0A7W6BWL4_9HYPH|nr:hypothetical protein [Aureimonas phyllosphaerae]MBB3938242.1 alkylhydroperoxidase family enzyme [Aureimonas phyllosphaerae]MBB3962249.1 alkylhydroperoxidase family enzyme [Aureimonas phyllosphaerae]SFF59751.1 hypothetical protein SAMN05216566_1449 [Aureimonas phyllosphaerae]
MNGEWLPAPLVPKHDEPITFKVWQRREVRREIAAARLTLLARGVHPGLDPVLQLAELEIIDIATGRGPLLDGQCRNSED